MQLPLGLHTTLHPECYHGRGQRPPFFEGWYYKLVDATGEHPLALIPGVFRGRDASERHAFVQVLDGARGTAHYCRFPESRFAVEPRALDARVANSRFTSERISLDIQEPDCQLTGELRLGPLTAWPATAASPGVMGWYAWAPFMQCYHGVVSLDHALEGTLNYNGRALDFSGGRGYIEKDWGRAFPAAWIWMQTNHFAQTEVCLTASIAIIPWLWTSFAGFLIGVWQAGKLHRFTTYTGARIERLEVADQHVRWVVSDRKLRLEIDAKRAAGAELLGPSQVAMGVRVAETLSSEIGIRLASASGKTLFEGTGRHAGLEVCGDLPRLLSLAGRIMK